MSEWPIAFNKPSKFFAIAILGKKQIQKIRQSSSLCGYK